MAYYDKALALGPIHIDALVNKGAALDLRRDEEAMRCFDRALEIDFMNPAALTNKAMQLIRLENFEGAVDYSSRALAMDPNNVRALSNKAFALYHLGDEGEALYYFDRALEVIQMMLMHWDSKGYSYVVNLKVKRLYIILIEH